MRRLIAAAAIFIATAATGCGGGDAPDTPATFTPSASALEGTGLRPFVVSYGGAPLVCMKSEWGSGNTRFGGLSCDWGRWRGEHPK